MPEQLDEICRCFAECVSEHMFEAANGWANVAMYRVSNERLRQKNRVVLQEWTLANGFVYGRRDDDE